MKRHLMTVVGLLVSIVLMATPITQDAARQKALQFLSGRSGNVAAARGMQQVRLQLKEGVVTDQLYVFNVGQREGFVIVSGDDCTGDVVLGYADKGEISAENMPVNLKAWLQGYADQIQWMQEHGVRSKSVAASRGGMRKTKAAIPAMLTTKWNQGTPYNTYCPTVKYSDNSYRLAATGCVATATAQIMFYQALTHGINQTTISKAIPAYFATESGVFWYFGNSGSNQMPAKEIHTINWDNIDAGLSTDAARDEVARLMEYVGASVEMQYGEESGAINEKVAWALPEYFSYDPDAKSIYQDDYDYSVWEDLIYNELSSNGPVLFGGQSSGGGHAFVVDGYNGNGYFHINWGWGGLSDGEYLLSVMKPSHMGTGGGSGSSDGYNSNVVAMINVKPNADDINLQDEARLSAVICTTPATLATKGSDSYHVSSPGINIGIPFNYNLINKSGWELNFDWGLAVFSGNTLKSIISSNSNIEMKSRQTNFGYFTGGIPLQSDGEYRIVLVSRRSGTSTWRECEGSDQHYIKAVVSGNNVTLTNMPAVIRITADDGSERALATAASLSIPEDALSVDLTSVSGISSVTPNSNPNTLYVVGTSVPSGLTDRNVVKNGVAESIELYDGYGFSSPTGFFYKKANYTRRFTAGANGSGGWSTLVLPFDVSSVKQGTNTIDWFHSGSETGKHFWLKRFSGESPNSVSFNYANQLTANKPYIIAVPGNRWPSFDLTNKDITFEGVNYWIRPTFLRASDFGSYFGFIGTTMNKDVTDCYVLNSDGNAFVKQSGTVAPFRAYFESYSQSANTSYLIIGNEDSTVTAIAEPKADSSTVNDAVYNLNGQRVLQPQKGLYIKDGKKVIIK